MCVQKFHWLVFFAIRFDSIRWFIPPYRFPICSFISFSTHIRSFRITFIFSLSISIWFSVRCCSSCAHTKFLLEWIHYYGILDGIIILFAIKQRYQSVVSNHFSLLRFFSIYISLLWLLLLVCLFYFSYAIIFQLTPSIWEMIDLSVSKCMSVSVRLKRIMRERQRCGSYNICRERKAHMYIQNKPQKCYLLWIGSHLQFIEYDILWHGFDEAFSTDAFHWWLVSIFFLIFTCHIFCICVSLCRCRYLVLFFDWNNAAYRLISMPFV